MDDLTLVNRALNEIGQSSVTSLDNTTHNAVIETALLHLAPVKRAVLRAVDWNCARKRTQLALVGAVDSNDSLGEWSNAYRITSGVLAVRRFVSTFQHVAYAKFSVELDSEDKPILYTNEGNGIIVYTGDVIDVNRWDAILADACVTGLAVEFATSIARDTKMAIDMLKLYQGKIEIAGGVDQAEGGIENIFDRNLVTVRQGGTGGHWW